MDLENLHRQILKDPFLSRLSGLAKREKVPFFLVGGYLRDLSLGIERKDYDFALPAEASSFVSTIESACGFHFFKVGKDAETSTFRMVTDQLSVDIAFFQGRDIEEDLHRRDFTINTLAFSLRDETWHWAPGAIEDIRGGRIRAVSSRSLDQDPLRMLRAVRYACTHDGFSIDETLKQEISLNSDLILKIPGERVKAELDRILLSPRPPHGIRILYDGGLLFAVFPELKGLEILGQGERHYLDVLSHTLLAVEKISWGIGWVKEREQALSFSEEDLLSLYYSILFHDIGKQDTYSNDEWGRVHFYHHETFSCRRAEVIMERLRFSNLLREQVNRLIGNHMRILTLLAGTREPALKRLVHQIGEMTPLLVIHTLADKEASRGALSEQNDELIEAHCLHLLQLFRQKEVVNPPSLVTGRDVMTLGYQAGPRIGQILGIIRQRQVEGEIKTREEALSILRKEFGLV